MRWVKFWMLSRALRDTRWEVRAQAAKGLGELAHPRTLALLAEALRDPKSEVRDGALAGIVRLGREALEPLLDLIHSEESGLREMAVAGLVQLGPPAVEPLLNVLRKETGPARQASIQALGLIKDVQAVPALRELLTDCDYVVRKLAVEALAKMWQPTIDPLIASLKDWNASVRASAAEALGQIGDKRVIEPLVKALGDKEENVRLAARDALIRLSDPSTVRVLLGAIESLSTSALEVVGDVLAAVGRKGLESLRPALNCEDVEIRLITVRVVAQCGKKKAVEYLLGMLEDPEPAVRKAVADSLVAVGWRPDTPVQRALHAVATCKWDAAVAEGAAAVEPLLKVVNEVTRTTRKAAVQALGQIGHRGAVGALISRLEDTFEDIRAAAIDALARIGDVQAVQPIAARLLDECVPVRRQACVSLGAMGDRSAVTPLSRALRDQDQGVRKAAAEALEQLAAVPERGAGGQAGAVTTDTTTIATPTQPVVEETPQLSEPSPPTQNADDSGRAGLPRSKDLPEKQLAPVGPAEGAEDPLAKKRAAIAARGFVSPWGRRRPAVGSQPPDGKGPGA